MRVLYKITDAITKEVLAKNANTFQILGLQILLFNIYANLYSI